ncbi:hypothetical protein E1301_Tti009556 [Triplophysa tibetana]|uniref:Uncharacterized protein n=1 Tax=Triplophysa tibetana TaxID=1572043 RepID=A0A5A9NFW0_9TELE|nr:hypothetical protein E1301_Tti009556 [Triplophysa tibetana]
MTLPVQKDKSKIKVKCVDSNLDVHSNGAGASVRSRVIQQKHVTYVQNLPSGKHYKQELKRFSHYHVAPVITTLSAMAVTPKSCHTTFASEDVDGSCEADLTPAAEGTEIASDKLTRRPRALIDGTKTDNHDWPIGDRHRRAAEESYWAYSAPFREVTDNKHSDARTSVIFLSPASNMFSVCRQGAEVSRHKQCLCRECDA